MKPFQSIEPGLNSEAAGRLVFPLLDYDTLISQSLPAFVGLALS